MAGYSATPLAKKLGIKAGSKLFLSNAPKNYFQLLSPMPPGVKVLPGITPDTDIVHLFVTQKTRLQGQLTAARKKIKSDAALWVSWPKKASKEATDITEDTIRELALPLGLVDIKVCAVDETWSGLKLVIRKEHRKPLPPPSQGKQSNGKKPPIAGQGLKRRVIVANPRRRTVAAKNTPQPPAALDTRKCPVFTEGCGTPANPSSRAASNMINSVTHHLGLRMATIYI